MKMMVFRDQAAAQFWFSIFKRKSRIKEAEMRKSQFHHDFLMGQLNWRNFLLAQHILENMMADESNNKLW